MRFAEIVELAKTPLVFTRIKLKFLFGEMEFERGSVLALAELSEIVEEILRKSFIERRAMWMNLLTESPLWSCMSIERTATALDEHINNLRGKLPASHRGLISLLGAWRSACVLTLKEMRAASAEDHIYARDVPDFPEILRQFRLRTYPIVHALIEILPADHPLRPEAQRTWYLGRATLTEEDKDAASEQWTIDA